MVIGHRGRPSRDVKDQGFVVLVRAGMENPVTTVEVNDMIGRHRAGSLAKALDAADPDAKVGVDEVGSAIQDAGCSPVAVRARVRLQRRRLPSVVETAMNLNPAVAGR